MANPLDEALRRLLETLTGQYGLSMQAATPFARKVLEGIPGGAEPIVGEELVRARRQQEVVDRPQRLQMQQRMNPGAPVIPGGPQRRSPAWDKFFGSLQIAELEAAARGQGFGVNYGGFGRTSQEPAAVSLARAEPLPHIRQRGVSVTGQQTGASVTGAPRGASVTGGPDIIDRNDPGTPSRSNSMAQAPIMGGIGQTLTYQQLRALEEELIRQTLRQTEARTKGLETEARLADPLEQVKAAATARAFQQRRDVGVVMPGENQIRPARGIRALTENAPEHVVKGITLTDQQMPIAALREDAEAFRDPNFPAAQQFREAQTLTTGAPGVTMARIQAGTADRRMQATQALQAAKDAAALARIDRQQSGATGRAELSAGTQRAVALARERINLIRARVDAERYTGGMFGSDPEIDRALAEAEDELRRLETAPQVAAPAPTLDPNDPIGLRRKP